MPGLSFVSFDIGEATLQQIPPILLMSYFSYGTAVEDSSQLYGISLYQPKVTELHMEGRLPFDARDIFAKLNIGYPNTPYLSQVSRRCLI